MSANPSGRLLAGLVVAGSLATAGYMFVANKQTKSEEKHASIYKSPEEGAGLKPESDARLASQEVRKVVGGERKP